MIRRGATCDLDCLEDFGEKFHAASPLAAVSEFDRPSFRAMATSYIMGFKGGVDGCLLVASDQGKAVGFLMAMVYPCWFNENIKTGQDLVWWIEPEYRSFKLARAMFDALEHWAREQGAHFFIMALTESMDPERLGRWYERRGYKLTERHYAKDLTKCPAELFKA